MLLIPDPFRFMSWIVFIIVAFAGATLIANIGPVDQDKPDIVRAFALLLWVFSSFFLRGVFARGFDSLLFAVGCDPVFAPRRFLFSRKNGAITKYRNEREAFIAWKSDTKNLVPIEDIHAEINNSAPSPLTAWYYRNVGESADFIVTRAWCRMANIDFDAT